MPYDEMLNWAAFFNSRPDGYAEDFRTYLLLKAQGIKESPESIFPSIKHLKAQEEKKQENDKAIPKGKFLDKLLSAKNGDGTKFKIGNSND